MPEHTTKNGVKKVTWHPGLDDSANLLGTVRTLDGCDGITTREPYDKGVVSRDGWAIIDESERQVFVPEDTDWKTGWQIANPVTDRIFTSSHTAMTTSLPYRISRNRRSDSPASQICIRILVVQILAVLRFRIRGTLQGNQVIEHTYRRDGAGHGLARDLDSQEKGFS